MPFEIQFGDVPKDLIYKIDHSVTKRNGKFTGNENEGKIEMPTPVGKVCVAYKITGNIVSGDILEKPLFIPEEMIK